MQRHIAVLKQKLRDMHYDLSEIDDISDVRKFWPSVLNESLPPEKQTSLRLTAILLLVIFSILAAIGFYLYIPL